MAKSKSSASSATRKKHARKAAPGVGPSEDPAVPKDKKPKGKEKKSKEPRKKVYIPPVKPAPVQPDPLDALGLAQRLPPELLVILRRFAKKDSTTKRRALEELQSRWVDRAKNDNLLLDILAETVPVWFHHVPALFLHRSRRIRLLAVGLHSSLLRLPSPVRDQLLFFIREVASADQAEYILGSWCVAAHDVDRQVSSQAHETWNGFVSLSDDSGNKLVLDSNLLSHLWEFIQRTLLDPGGVYSCVNPPQPVLASPVPQRKGAERPVPPRRDEDVSVRARTEEDDESESDRSARLRVGAFGAAEWVINSMAALRVTEVTEEFLAPFANPAIWSSLYHAETPPFVQLEAFGRDQPAVRRAAWQLALNLVRTCKSQVKMLLPVLSSAVLRSAWVDPDQNVRGTMWQPLLTFLREFPQAWELDAASEKVSDEADDSDAEDSEDESAAKQPVRNASDVPSAPSQAYREFLQFLELGCSGSPLQGYPAVLIILSTIPAAIFASSSSTSPLSELFASFWAAVDGRALSALDRVATSAAFLSSLLECLVFLLRRLLKSTPEQASLLAQGAPAAGNGSPRSREETAHELVREQIARIWDELSSRRLKVDGAAAAALLTQTLASLYQLDPGLFRTAWDALASGIKGQFGSDNAVVSPLVSTMLNTFRAKFGQASDAEGAAKTLTSEVVQATIQQCEDILNSDDTPAQERVISLVDIVEKFGESLFSDPGLTQTIDDAMLQYTYRLLMVSPSLLLVYFLRRRDETLLLSLWHDILLSIASHEDGVGSILPPLLDATEKGLLPEYLRPQANELDNLTGSLLADALSGPPGTIQVSLIRRILRTPDHFVSYSCLQGLLQSLSSAFTLHFQSVMHDETVSLDAFDVPLDLIHMLIARSHWAPSSETLMSLIPNIFVFAYLLPLVQPVDPKQQLTTRQVWEAWLAEAQEDAKVNTLAVVRQRLRELFADSSVRPSPEHILRMLAGPHPGLHIDVMSDILPTRDTLEDMLSRLPSTPSDASLAVVDLLVPPASLYKPKRVFEPVYDGNCLSEYPRVVNGLLQYLGEDRHAARVHVWAIRHFLALYLYADELLRIPSAHSGLFAAHISKTSLQEIANRVLQVTTYVLSSVQDEGWHLGVTKAIVTEQEDARLDGVGRLVFELVSDARREDTVRESRILHIILQHMLDNATKAEANQWMTIVRRLEKPAPQTSLAILSAVTRYAPEPPLLDRYRNELAAGMLGVRPSKANTDGLWLLRRLAASAPDPDSDIVFLSETRAVNLMKVCQQWVTSDEDLDEDVESEMANVFFHLAPILQNIPGAHWDLIFDVTENNLENSSFTGSSTLVMLSRTLRLVIAIQDLASTNKSLRSVWKDRQTACLTLVRDLVATKLDPNDTSVPLSVCRELALQIVQDLPASLIDETTLAKMCHVVTDASFDVQRMAYHLLRDAARKYTEHIAIEAAVDSEAVVKPELPLELINILQWNLNYEDGTDQEGQNLSGYLLTWMVTFDLFANASLKVKAGYIEQLRNLDLVAERFLPNILSILGLYEGIAKAFKLGIWAVEEYHFDLYFLDSPLSLRLLAAHLYYRALLVVPSLIRNWLLDCRDRQLLNAVTSYTSIHFSPAIIKTELTEVRDPVATADITDENLTIKVASAVNEVTASYAVDDHQLELTVKLPPDYPLHGIEIRGTKRVGVPEERWRAWLLGVQILTTRNGNIVDGLSFFKKNVASHFEGMVECAICYSLLSATDGSLPRKPCKTCKNLFHAGCLYKWFNTSHSSSCPLCRSEII